MYKRKPKSGSLGIVRSKNISLEQENPPQENASPNTTRPRTVEVKGANSLINKSVGLVSTSESKGRIKPGNVRTPNSLMLNATSQGDPDEVLSDSEPSPKRSRRFLNSSSSNSASKINNNNEEIILSSTNNKNIESTMNQSYRQSHSTHLRGKPATQHIEFSKGLSPSPTKVSPRRPRSNQNGGKNGSKRNQTNKFSDNIGRPNNGTLLEDFFDKTGFILSDGNSSNILSK